MFNQTHEILINNLLVLTKDDRQTGDYSLLILDVRSHDLDSTYQVYVMVRWPWSPITDAEGSRNPMTRSPVLIPFPPCQKLEDSTYRQQAAIFPRQL